MIKYIMRYIKIIDNKVQATIIPILFIYDNTVMSLSHKD